MLEEKTNQLQIGQKEYPIEMKVGSKKQKGEESSDGIMILSFIFN